MSPRSAGLFQQVSNRVIFFKTRAHLVNCQFLEENFAGPSIQYMCFIVTAWQHVYPFSFSSSGFFTDLRTKEIFKEWCFFRYRYIQIWIQICNFDITEKLIKHSNHSPRILNVIKVIAQSGSNFSPSLYSVTAESAEKYSRITGK